MVLKEAGYGLYDGLTGLVIQPTKGAMKEGAVGFGKGVFKGAMGVAFKPASGEFSRADLLSSVAISSYLGLLSSFAGISGLVGFTADGIMKQCKKIGYTSVKDFIRVSRLTQGFEEMQQTSPEKQAVILERWHHLQLERKRKGKKKVAAP